MRLTPEKLKALTGGLTQHAAQARWFRTQFGVEVPRDEAGPIMTRAAFEKLIAAKLGLDRTTVSGGERPRVSLQKERP